MYEHLHIATFIILLQIAFLFLIYIIITAKLCIWFHQFV